MLRIVPIFLLLLASLSASGNEKLVALTFDDGPRPYVLFGQSGAPGLIHVLDQAHVNATFFVMGWRLTPRTWGDHRFETNIGINCVDAVRALVKRGDEIEDHTYSHVQLETAEKSKGEAWVIHDIQHGAELIEAVSGRRPVYVRPPDWILPEDARHDLEQRGYHILTIKGPAPVPLRDINSLDYLCAGLRPVHCPKPSLSASVLRQIELREKKGIYTHILAFHELSTTTTMLPELITDLRARGYRFVTIREYMKLVGPHSITAQNDRPHLRDVSHSTPAPPRTAPPLGRASASPQGRSL
ncbi:MAG: polysaccharide deacetylase family protein [Acidobacteria bacterium]|nr:polysaccharide deacetylase family protein [Acidobacteriota bacterium]